MLERFMDNKFKKIEEQTAILQAELSQMSDELYAQQKEIEQLRVEIGNLKSKLQNVPTDSGILTADEDVPPPHY
jgi:SlyX protein